ncbi:hypothetical protein BDN72DRAFT_898911 [Pluteus cervinus]|uniref:Uncharacterized protein n=1 Tax=Pluteus cervinus TaxID=181527 RepID=A0ACD3ARG7_9AGAR|nr:hypothetical protein BDN72DRAFT_898911 [Pluteus cervinus]
MPPRKKINKPATTTKKTNNSRGQKKSVTFALPPPTNASTLLPTPVAQPPRPPHRISVPTPYNPSREYLDAVKEVWALAKAYKIESERIFNEHNGDERLSEDVKEYVDGVVMNVHAGESDADTDTAKYNIFKKSLEYERKQELAAYLDDPAVKEDLLDIIERVQEENRVQNEELKEDEGEEGQSDDNELEAAKAGGVVVEHDEDDTNAAAALLSLHDQGPHTQEKESKKTEGEEEKADDYRPEGAKANAVVTEHNDEDNNGALLLLSLHYQSGTAQGIEVVPSSTAPGPEEGPKETAEKKQPKIQKQRAPKAKPMVPEENARPVRRGRSATAKALAEEESAPKSSDEKEETKETETKEPRKPLSQIDNGQVDNEPQAGPSSEKAPATKATAKSRGGKRKRGDEEDELLDTTKGVAKEKKSARPRKKRTT